MFLSNLIFRFKIKRKDEREYRGGILNELRELNRLRESGRMFKREDLEACHKYSWQLAYLEAYQKRLDDTLKLLYDGLPTKEETPDFIDRLDEELRRK